MIYTLSSLKSFIRGKDERLEDITYYPDEALEVMINDAFEAAESAVAVFFTTETFDMSVSIENNLSSESIVLNQEPHFIYEVELAEPNITYSITENNQLIITFNANADRAVNKNVVVHYFYYPTTFFTEINMSPEVYNFYTHCLSVEIFRELHDKENEMYHQAQVDKLVQSGTFPLPFNFDKIQQDKKFNHSSWI